MAVYRVVAPAAGFNGPRAGVQFRDGVAVVDDADEARALAYFRRRGYRVEPKPPAQSAPAQSAPAQSAPAQSAPAQSAPKADWVAWAVAQFRLAEDEAEKLTKADLIARYGQ